MKWLAILTVGIALPGAGPATLSSATGVWIGLGPDGADISSFAIDPQDSNTLYVTSNAGVSKSTDGARTWNQANSGLPGVFVRGIAVDPQAPSTLYVSSANGLFKSTDAAATWSPASSGLPAFPPGNYRFVTSFALDPVIHDTVYAGLCCNDGAVFKTTDGGAGWRQAGSGLSGSMQILAAAPKNSGTVYAATSNGLFKTTDGGADWALTNLRPTCCVNVLAIDPQASNTLYVGTCCGNAGSGLFKSSDGGATWTAMNHGLNSTNPGPIAVYSVALDPRDSLTLYAATGGGFFKTTDGAATWNRIDAGSLTYVTPLGVDPQDGALYFGTGSGLFKSNDGAATWSPAGAGLRAIVQSIAPDPANAANLYAVTPASVSKSLDGGATWKAANNGLPGNEISGLVIASQNSSTLYAGVFGGGDNTGGVFKSLDGGASWNGSKVPHGGGVEGVAIDPQDSNTLYGWNSQGLYKTVDGAATWTVVGPGSIWGLVVDPHNSAVVYGIRSDGIVQSTDGGAAWTPLNSGLPSNWHPRSVSIDPQDSATLYTWNAIYDPAGVKLFKTTDGGVTWNLANFGLQGNSLSSLVINPQNPGILYAASQGFDASGMPVSAVFATADGGAHWTLLNPGPPPQLSISALAISPQATTHLYAATSVGTFATTLSPP